MPRATQRIRLAQPQRIAGADLQALAVAGSALMRELADRMARGLRAELPAGLGRETGDEIIEPAGREPGLGEIKRAAALEGALDVAAQRALARVGAERVAAAVISLVGAEHGPEVEIDHIVRLDHPVHNGVVIAEHRIRAGANDAVVPVAAGAK